MKSCSSCGRHLEDPERFCDRCGAPQSVAPSIPYRPPQTVRLPRLRGMQINIMRLSVVLLLVGATIGFTIGAATFYSSQRPGTQTLTVTNTATSLQRVTETKTQFVTITQTVMNTSVATGTGAWREIKRFTGSASTTTEPFNVPATMWRIQWSYTGPEGAALSILIYRMGDSVSTASVLSMTPGSGMSYVYVSGDFYLKITTGVAYSIIVEAPA